MSGNSELRPLNPLPLGTLKPAGWLERQLRLQCAGPTTWLARHWPDIARSRWIGGDAEGWERGPYWLDGAVPLAILTGDPTLSQIVRHWVDHLLAHQHEDGWMGDKGDGAMQPGTREPRALDPWPLFLVGKALLQWEDATGDPRVVPALERMLARIARLLETEPLTNWAKMRWMELALVCVRMHRKIGAPWLLDLARTAETQGYDWCAHFDAFAYPEKSTEWTLETHVVNHAMALKVPAVRALLGADPATEWRRFQAWRQLLARHHGQATGVFSGDECLAGTSPSQGTETCAVVEMLYSLEVTQEVLSPAAFPSTALSALAERIAFNALPAAFTPDMHGHQYDQQVNQIAVGEFAENVYTTNGPRANVFGLEPNFGCCTANQHQGWPKFVAHLWMRDADGGFVALSYAPCTIETADAAIAVTGDYPFRAAVEIAVTPKTGPVVVHLPHLGRPNHPGAVTVDGRPLDGPIRIDAPRVLRVTFGWDGWGPESPWTGAKVVWRGPLLFALPVPGERRAISGEAPAQDWEIRPTGAWNWALESSGAATEHGVGEVPFDPAHPPVTIRARVRPAPEWGADRNAAAPPPASVPPGTPAEERDLVPYAFAPLRIAVFPPG